MSDDKHCAEIGLDEAVHIVQQCVNQYRSFKKMHEVLKLAQAAEQRVKEAETTRKSLDSDIEARRSTLEGLTKSIADSKDDLKNASSVLVKRIEECETEYAAKELEAQEKFDFKIEDLRIKLREAEEAHTLVMNDLTADEKSAQSRVDEIRKILAELKKTTQSVTGA